jgi:trimeric autotransporter adhesin
MKLSPSSHLTLSLITAAVATLTACGGGGGSTASTTPAATSSITTTVMDGLISNALVCVDTNSNNLCDAGEVQGRTDAAGKVTLTVAATDAATAKLIAIVGTDAVDADTGAVKTAYTLQTPAGKTAVISPLTTMVQTKIDTDKVTAAVAETYVKTQTGLTVSVYDNFIALRGQSAEHTKAGEIAHMVVLSIQGATTATSTTTATACTTATNATTVHTENETNEAKETSARTTVLGRLSDFDKAATTSVVAQACSSGKIDEHCSSIIKTTITALSCPTTSTTTGTTTTTTGTTTVTTPAVTTTTVTTPVVTTPVVTTPVVTTPVATTSAATGKVLYAANCAMCHGANAAQNISNVLRGANSATTILNAISANRGGMSFLNGTVGATQAADLAAFLATPGI